MNRLELELEETCAGY